MNETFEEKLNRLGLLEAAEALAKRSRVRLADLAGRSRSHRTVAVRRELAKMLRALKPQWTLEEIGALLGRHCSVIQRYTVEGKQGPASS